MKKQLALAAFVALAATSSAAIVTTGTYSFDFGTTSANANPFATDTTGGHNVTNAQAASVSASTGSAAPSGSGTTVTATGAGGIFGNSVPYNYTAGDWGVTLWVRVNNNTGGALMVGDNSATGVYLGRDAASGQFNFSGVGPGGIAATIGTWYQLTAINYGGTMTFFVNQTRVATGVTTTENRFNAPMFNFGVGGNNSIGSSSFDEMKVVKFDSATDSLSNVQAALGVPEPGVALLGGLSALALLRRRRN